MCFFKCLKVHKILHQRHPSQHEATSDATDATATAAKAMLKSSRLDPPVQEQPPPKSAKVEPQSLDKDLEDLMDEMYDADSQPLQPCNKSRRTLIGPKGSDTIVQQKMTNIFDMKKKPGDVAQDSSHSSSSKGAMGVVINAKDVKETEKVAEAKIAKDVVVAKGAASAMDTGTKEVVEEKKKNNDNPSEINTKEVVEEKKKNNDNPSEIDTKEVVEEKKKNNDNPSEMDTKEVVEEKTKNNDNPSEMDTKGVVEEKTKTNDNPSEMDTKGVVEEKTKNNDNPSEMDTKGVVEEKTKTNDNPSEMDTKEVVENEEKKTKPDNPSEMDAKEVVENEEKKTKPDNPSEMDAKEVVENEEKKTKPDNPSEMDAKEVVDEDKIKTKESTSEMDTMGDGTRSQEHENNDIDHAISVARQHQHVAIFAGDSLAVLSDDPLFTVNPLDDIRNFNEWLIEHSEEPIPYTWNGNREGVLVVPLNAKLTKEAANDLVNQAMSHESFKVYHSLKLQPSIALDLGYVFGKVNPIMDVNLFGHWLRCEGKSPLVNSLSASDMQSDPDTGHVCNEDGKALSDQSDVTQNDVNSDADSDVEDPEHFHYPPAPTCDHPSIKNLLSSAAKAGIHFFF